MQEQETPKERDRRREWEQFVREVDDDQARRLGLLHEDSYARSLIEQDDDEDKS